MATKTDIDALKIFKKPRTNEAENQQKLSSTQDLPVLEECSSTCSLLKNLET